MVTRNGTCQMLFCLQCCSYLSLLYLVTNHIFVQNKNLRLHKFKNSSLTYEKNITDILFVIWKRSVFNIENR
jgi:hypothetical protein